MIVLPIVFDNEPKTITQDLTIQIPSQDSGKFSPRTIAPAIGAAPAASEPPAEAIPPASTASNPANASQRPVAANPVPVEPKPDSFKELAVANGGQPISAEAAKSSKSGQKSEIKSVRKSTLEAATAAQAQSQVGTDEPSQGTYFVPLGSFGKPENVRAVQSKVAAAGFKSYSEKSAGSSQTRVRAGPFPTRAAAEDAREKLKGADIGVGPVGSR